MSASANAPASGAAITAASVAALLQHLRDWRRPVDLTVEGRVIGTLSVGLFDKPSGDIVMEGYVVGRISQGKGEGADGGLTGFGRPAAAEDPGESCGAADGSGDQRRPTGLTAIGLPSWVYGDPDLVMPPAPPVQAWCLPASGVDDLAGFALREQLLADARGPSPPPARRSRISCCRISTRRSTIPRATRRSWPGAPWKRPTTSRSTPSRARSGSAGMPPHRGSRRSSIRRPGRSRSPIGRMTTSRRSTAGWNAGRPPSRPATPQRAPLPSTS